VRPKKTYDIAMRGHHLKAFYILFFLERDWGPAHQEIKDSLLGDLRFKVGLRNFTKVLDTFKKIKNESGLKIKITSSTNDFVCSKCRQKRSKYCTVRIPAQEDPDQIIPGFYGLKVGEIYSAEFIIRQLKERGLPNNEYF
jgi:hypothetical protein